MQLFHKVLFLIYINDLPDKLTSMCKIFADDTSLFSKVIDKNNSNSQLNSDHAKTIKWAFQWKRFFTPDPNKQAIEVRFSNKRDKENYSSLQFNSTDVQIADSQKHLGLILDSKFHFNEHIESKITKGNKIIGLMKKPSFTLSTKSLLTIYKSFVRPNLDYADIIYDKTLSKSFKRKTEMVEYNALVYNNITGVFNGTSRDKIYQELGLESLVDRRWTRKLVFFHKIILGLLPSYLKYCLIPHDNLRTYLTGSSTQKTIKTFPARTKTFELSFSPHFPEAWENLSEELRNIDSRNTFKSSMLIFVRPRENSVFAVHEINGVKLQARLRFGFRHLNEHKLSHNFNDCVRAVKNPKQLSTTSWVETFFQFLD